GAGRGRGRGVRLRWRASGFPRPGRLRARGADRAGPGLCRQELKPPAPGRLGARRVHARRGGVGLGPQGGLGRRRGARPVAGRVRGGRTHGRSALSASRRALASAGRCAGPAGRDAVSRPRLQGWLRSMVLLAWLAVPVMAAMPATVQAEQAEHVVLTRETELPALPAGTDPATLAMVAGQVLAEAEGKAWALAPDAADWRQVQLPDGADARMLDVTGHAARGYRLMGAGLQLQRIEAVSWTGDRLVAEALPALPGPLRAPRAAVLGNGLYVAGLDDDGRSRLWALDTAGTGSWRSLDGWPGDAGPASLAAQRSALYLADADGELWRWTADGGWSRRARLPAPAVPGQAVAVGQAHLLYVLRTATGDQAQLFHVITDAWADWPGATPVGATG